MILSKCHKNAIKIVPRTRVWYTECLSHCLVVPSFLSWRVGGHGKHFFSVRYALKQSSMAAMVTDVFTVNNTLRKKKAVEHTAGMPPSQYSQSARVKLY